MQAFDVIVIGAGIFGVTAAIELQRRGYTTCLADPGPIPHPLAASTDISKVVRMEYGTDDQYMEMVEACMPRWGDWNAEFAEPLYHETGITMFTHDEMAPGGFEYESFHMLKRRGHAPERLDTDEIIRRFPAWNPGVYNDGFFHAVGGFAESGRVVSALVERARNAGVVTREGFRVASIRYGDNRGNDGRGDNKQGNGEAGLRGIRDVDGVRSSEGETMSCGQVVVAAGAWTPLLVPDVAVATRVTGHPIFHLRAKDDRLFRTGTFATFMADVARTGWYGFPVHPREGVIKMANHGVGVPLHPDDERTVTSVDEAALRQFLSKSFPEIADAAIVYTRNCLYCDTLDEHFLIDTHPEISGLTVATGGSGHGFKFAPILGNLIADAVERIPNRWLPRFAWRSYEKGIRGEEASRFHG